MNVRYKRLIQVCSVAFLIVLAFCVTKLVFASPATKWPEPPGWQLLTDNKLQLDADHVGEGYIQVALLGSTSHRLKLRIATGQNQMTYDLNNEGRFEIFPLQLGEGKYEVSLYENVSGTKYAAAGKVSFNVMLNTPDAPFYYPNQYVYYNKTTEAVAVADQLCEGQAPQDAYKTICMYIKDNYTYDFNKAATISASVLPDIPGCYTAGKGICQDLSALTCCMMRTQGIPARLMIGYADGNYHAWVEARMGGLDYFFDPSATIGGVQTFRTYSVERYY